MPTISPKVTPYYGGGQVVNPANVKKTSGAPSSKLTDDLVGTLAVDNSAGNIYGLASKSGGVDTWVLLGGSSGAVSSVLGTANQITANTVGNVVTLSLPAAITAPGSLTTTTTLTGGTGITATTGNIAASSGNLSASGTVTGGTGVTATTGNVVATAGAVNAGTSMTATLGNITATNGNVVLNTAGNKLVIATGSNASVGTSGVMSGTPGAVTVATTASSATAKIFFARNITGGTPGEVSITAQDGTGFTLTSTGNENIDLQLVDH